MNYGKNNIDDLDDGCDYRQTRSPRGVPRDHGPRDGAQFWITGKILMMVMVMVMVMVMNDDGSNQNYATNLEALSE